MTEWLANLSHLGYSNWHNTLETRTKPFFHSLGVNSSYNDNLNKKGRELGSKMSTRVPVLFYRFYTQLIFIFVWGTFVALSVELGYPFIKQFLSLRLE